MTEQVCLKSHWSESYVASVTEEIPRIIKITRTLSLCTIKPRIWKEEFGICLMNYLSIQLGPKKP
jgi:hypothetical protein